jgi:hypothetical protein
MPVETGGDGSEVGGSSAEARDDFGEIKLPFGEGSPGPIRHAGLPRRLLSRLRRHGRLEREPTSPRAIEGRFPAH